MRLKQIFRLRLMFLFWFVFVKRFGKIMPYKGSCFIIDKSAILKIEGLLITNDNCFKKNGRSTIIRVDKNAKLCTKGSFSIYYDGDIIIFEDGVLELGSGFCNSNVKIRCKNKNTTR